MDASLEDLYNTELLGAANPQTLKDRAAKIGISLTLEQAKNFIRSHQTAQQFRYVNPRPFHVPIVAKPNQYACDLMFVQRGTEKVPILVVEELTSRRGYARVMPNKTAPTTAATFRLVLGDIEKEGLKVESMEHDAGSEFKGAFRTLLNERNIEDIVFPRGNASKTALGKLNVMIRTIRTMLLKATMNFGGDWRTKLADVLNFYNSVKSVATGFAPKEVDEDAKNYIRAKELGKGVAARSRVNAFKEGQQVRVLQDYDVFRQHRVKAHFSAELYTIEEREGYSFKLKNSRGEWVMAVSEEGDPQNYVRLWRAWELLPVDSAVKPPEQEPSQELPVREQRKANITNRERRALDVPVLENPADLPPHPQPVRNVAERALKRAELPEREREQTEAAKENERKRKEAEERRAERALNPPAPRPAPQPLGQEKATDPEQWFVERVLSHRRRRGKLEFQIQWKGIPKDDVRRERWWALTPTFRSYDKTSRTWVVDDAVGKYMAEHKLR
jgi:hypothetical protein